MLKLNFSLLIGLVVLLVDNHQSAECAGPTEIFDAPNVPAIVKVLGQLERAFDLDTQPMITIAEFENVLEQLRGVKTPEVCSKLALWCAFLESLPKPIEAILEEDDLENSMTSLVNNYKQRRLSVNLVLPIHRNVDNSAAAKFVTKPSRELLEAGAKEYLAKIYEFIKFCGKPDATLAAKMYKAEQYIHYFNKCSSIRFYLG